MANTDVPENAADTPRELDSNKKCFYVRLFCLLHLITVTFFSGCVSVAVLEPPPDWPDPWRGRSLFHTQFALIYATSEAAAYEADRAMSEIANKYEYFKSEKALAGGEKGLIVAIDKEDEPLTPTPDEQFDLFIRGYAELSGFDRPQAKQMKATREHFQKLDGPIGELLPDILSAVPTPIALRDVVATLEFPASVQPAAAWATSFPTDAKIRAAANEMIPKVLDFAQKQGDVTGGMRLLIRPWMGMLTSTLAAELSSQRNITFEEIARQNDPAWIAKRNTRRDSLKEWRILIAPNQSTSSYEAVLARSEATVLILPDDVEVLRVLAAAQYRSGRYEASVATYKRISEIRTSRRDQAGSSGLAGLAKAILPSTAGEVDKTIDSVTRQSPVDLSFLAMAEMRLGNKEGAHSSLKAAQELTKDRQHTSILAKAIIAEAETVIGSGKPSDKTVDPEEQSPMKMRESAD